jgi:hypothetical protein
VRPKSDGPAPGLWVGPGHRRRDRRPSLSVTVTRAVESQNLKISTSESGPSHWHDRHHEDFESDGGA